jgi:hypothetical protein
MGNITGAQATVQDAGNLLQCATVQRFAQGTKTLAGLAFFPEYRS